MDKLFCVFGLDTNASKGELKKQYRKLAKQIHPDKNNDPASKIQFVKLTRIYDILTKYIDLRDNENNTDQQTNVPIETPPTHHGYILTLDYKKLINNILSYVENDLNIKNKYLHNFVNVLEHGLFYSNDNFK